MNKSYAVQGIAIVILLIAILSVKSVLLGGATRIELSSAAPLTGQISQALITSGAGNTLQVAGKDYTLANTTYFDNQTWAVTHIDSTSGNTANSGLAVLQVRSGIFQVVLGPGSAFAESYVQNLPADVAEYLNGQGAVYDSVN